MKSTRPGDYRIIDPLSEARWDEWVSSYRASSVFHTRAWIRVLTESYGFSPVCFVWEGDGAPRAIVCLMEARSLLTGRRAVGLPFTDYCDPLARDGIDLADLIPAVREYGCEAGWRSIELRVSGAGADPGLEPSAEFLGHGLDLTPGAAGLLRALSDSSRRNVRKAGRDGVTGEILRSSEAMDAFCRLNLLTRRAHGLPPQPRAFFRHFFDHLIAPGHGFISLARVGGEAVAADVFLLNGRRAVYKYGASDMRFQHLRPGNLAMWQAIEWLAENGCESLCFGRTERENEGLDRYKRGWGAQPGTVRYYKFDPLSGRTLHESPRVEGFHNRIFRHMPLPLLQAVGSALYRHVA